MKITFKGVPGEQHSAIDMYGQHFPLGQAVEVTSPFAVRKLKQHPHFSADDDVSDAKVVGEVRQEAGAVHAAQAAQALAVFAVETGAAGQLAKDAQAGKPVDDLKPAPEAETSAKAINTGPMAREAKTREEMELRATSLGVKVDGRWNDERLGSVLLNAEAAAARQV